MKLSSLHRLGLFHQKIREANGIHEELMALNEYKAFMDEIEADAFASYQEREAVQCGKTSA